MTSTTLDRSGRTSATVLLALTAALGGLAAGVTWSDRIVSLFKGTPVTEQPASHAEPHQLWTCGMHPQVIQDKPGFCPICGMQLTPLRSAPPKKSAPAEREVAYWWDPMMSPPYVSDRPGKSPMGMDLVPVYADEVSAGPVVTIDPAIVQNMGVRLATVVEGPLRRTIRAVGSLEEAQPLQRDVNLRVSGWIVRLYADTQGEHIESGAPLFDLYSPELQVAIEELIAGRRARDAAAGNSVARQTAERVYSAAERKLKLLGLAPAQITTFAARERAPEAVTFTSPISGHLIEKTVVEGAAVKAGERVLRIVDHSTLWLEAQIYEQQLPFIHLGQRVRATVVGRPGEIFDGEITFVHPHVETTTRTAMVRVALSNTALHLRPGMYATVEIDAELDDKALLVPREAIIDTGTRQITFVARDGGHFEPRKVTTGAAGADGVVQVLSGLAPGESVVASGQFLLDAESRMQEAIQKMLAEKQGSSRGPTPSDADTRHPTPGTRP